MTPLSALGPSLLVLFVAVAAIAIATWPLQRCLTAGGWRRVWGQASLLSVILVTVAECLGVSSAVVECWRQAWAAEVAPPLLAANDLSLAEVVDDLAFLDREDQQPDAESIDQATVNVSPDDRLVVERGAPPLDPSPPSLTIAGSDALETKSSDRQDDGLEPAPLPLDAPPWSVPNIELAMPPVLTASPAPATSSVPRMDQVAPWANRSTDRWAGQTALLIWMLGASVLAIRYFRAYVASLRLAASARRDPDLQAMARELSQRMLDQRFPLVLTSNHVEAPCVVGWFRPTIIAPTDFRTSLPPAQQQAVLAHELAHWRGRDPLWRGLSELTTAALWWHPLMWSMRRWLGESCEDAADEAAALVPDGPDLLAASLVAWGGKLAAPAAATGGGGFRSQLGRRVQRLLAMPTKRWSPPRKDLSLTTRLMIPWAMVSLITFGTAWARPRAEHSLEETSMHVLQTHWRRSLAAASLWATLTPLTLLAQEPAKQAEPSPPTPPSSTAEPIEAPQESGDASLTARIQAELAQALQQAREQQALARAEADRAAAVQAFLQAQLQAQGKDGAYEKLLARQQLEREQFSARSQGSAEAAESPKSRTQALAEQARELIAAGRLDAAMEILKMLEANPASELNRWSNPLAEEAPPAGPSPREPRHLPAPPAGYGTGATTPPPVRALPPGEVTGVTAPPLAPLAPRPPVGSSPPSTGRGFPGQGPSHAPAGPPGAFPAGGGATGEPNLGFAPGGALGGGNVPAGSPGGPGMMAPGRGLAPGAAPPVAFGGGGRASGLSGGGGLGLAPGGAPGGENGPAGSPGGPGIRGGGRGLAPGAAPPAAFGEWTQGLGGPSDGTTDLQLKMSQLQQEMSSMKAQMQQMLEVMETLQRQSAKALESLEQTRKADASGNQVTLPDGSIIGPLKRPRKFDTESDEP